MSTKTPTYKNLLVKGSSLSSDQVDSIMQLTDSSGTTMDELLGDKTLTNIDEALEFVCGFLKTPFIKEIPAGDIPPDLVRDIPLAYAKKHEILPFKDEQNELTVLCSNPLKIKNLDDLRVIFNKPIQPVVAASHKVIDAINQVYEKSTASLDGLDSIDEEDDFDLDDPVIDLLDGSEDDAPVIKLVNNIIFRAVKEKASDIHIEPYEKDMAVRFRIDGILFDIFKPNKRLQNAITSRIKVMGNLNIAEKRLPQDGNIPLKFAGKDIDVRLSTLPTAFGERIVMRLQDRTKGFLKLEQLGFSQQSMKQIDDLLEKTYGIFLVTGPTGSGKSTTLYACLDKINTIDKNIITVENPVEQRMHGVGQIQVNEKIGLTFAEGLRSILRQDPNVIMVGEIRDLDTAEISINASLTGHLVLSTIHTNDSAGVFPRLIDMGCEPFLIATSLLGVVAQRLVRLLCPHCKAPHTPTELELKNLELTQEQVAGKNIFKPVGCKECNHKGYMGRTIIQELLPVSEEVRTLIMQRKDGGTIKKKAVEDGMMTLRDHGIEKVLQGLSSIEEILSNTQVDQ